MIKYFEMEPGQRWGALTAVKNTGKTTLKGREIWEFKCDCGRLVRYSVLGVIKAVNRDCGCGAAKKKKRRKRRVVKPPKETLCWSCANATGFCSWSHDFTPVPGWTAQDTTLHHATDRSSKSYHVISCPEFVKG